MPVRFTDCGQFTDGIAERGEFLFVFGHDIALAHHVVMVQVISTGGDFPDRGTVKLLYGEVEKPPIISLEFYLPAFCKDMIVEGKVFF